MDKWGENIWSDVDWNKTMLTAVPEPNWIIADDFEDPYVRPVLTVRWWGSYAPEDTAVPPVVQHGATGGAVPVPQGPGVEDAYMISFFRDIPGPRYDPNNPTAGYSLPDSSPTGLLGSYLIPFERVRWKSTPYLGWDGHPIYEYEADLWAACLDHQSDLARPDGFYQRPGERYWISIAAEVGHEIFEVATPDGSTEWISEDNGKEALRHYWGWHTSPIEFGDVATMTKLFMPPAQPGAPVQWEYFPNWNPIQPQHHLWDMAFELLTIPEPATSGLAAVAALALAIAWRRRR